MADVELTCRICRGESTASQPLLHPCKCRGSIKYIHQECLMEWLSHQGRRDKKCDICDTPYRFKTIYDANMPLRMPFGEIFTRIVTLVGTTTFRVLSFIFFALCAAQIPLFWKFVGRLFSYAVDGKISVPQFTARQVLLYGAYNTNTSTGKLLSDDSATFAERAETFFFKTYAPGLFQVILFVFVLFVVFIEHEWVVREEGYTKLLLRQIGREPRTKLADLLGLMRESAHEQPRIAEQAQHPGDGENVAAPATPAQAPMPEESQLNRAIEDLRLFQAQGAHESSLHRALDRLEHRELVQSSLNLNMGIGALNRNEDDSLDAAHFNSTQTDAPLPYFPGFVNQEPALSQHNGPHNGVSDDQTEGQLPAPVNFLANINAEAPINPFEEIESAPENEMAANANVANGHVDPHQNIENNINLVEERAQGQVDLDLDDETAEELERRQNLVEDEMMAAEAANENILELLGFRFNLITPIQLMILADFFVFIFLFGAYLVPHTIGNLFVYGYMFLVNFVWGLCRTYMPGSKALHAFKGFVGELLASFAQKAPFLNLICLVLNDIVFKPLHTCISRVLDPEKAVAPSFWERAVYLGIGWLFICDTINKYMKNLVAREKPVTGTLRKIYKVLFRIVATAKVFAIFGIEIVVFPIYCGFLLDICLAPLFVENFIVVSDAVTHYHFLLTTSPLLSLSAYFRAVAYWLAGTCYMFFIALFVSMVRSKILRLGVLYFIKSPEDPNARLIHDAVVKPFKLQISRILLSAKVYLTLILGGIGSVTWGLRFFLNSPTASEPGALLPMNMPGSLSLLFLFYPVYCLVNSRDVLAEPCKIFWDRLFAVLCHKLRLSHFILDRPVPQERGYVVYRNLFYRLFQVGVPDYTKPVSYLEAQAIFRTDSSILACFVPDGNYIRAPSSDDNSRMFLKRVFIPVTKSDQLITLNGSEGVDFDSTEDDTDWWDADITYEDSYAVVYSPPNLRLRCFYLVFGVCAFGALLAVTFFTLSLVVGTSLVLTLYKLGYLLKLPVPDHDFRFADLGSVLLGAWILVWLVALYNQDMTLDRARNIILEMWNRRRQPRAEDAFAQSIVNFFISNSIIFFHLHFEMAPLIEEYFFGLSFLVLLDGSDSLKLPWSWKGVALQLACTLGTLLPCSSVGQYLTAEAGQGVWLDERTKALNYMAVLSTLPFFVDFALSGFFGEHKALISAWLHAFAAAVVVIVRGTLHMKVMLRTITEQIKKEKYVRGTAVENMPGEDER